MSLELQNRAVLPIVGTLMFHLAFGAGLWGSGKFERKKKKKPETVEFEVEPPKVVETKPKPLPKKVAIAPKLAPPKVDPKQPPPKRQRTRRPPPPQNTRRLPPPPKNQPPPPENTDPNPDPAPGEGSDDTPYRLTGAVPSGTFGTPRVGGQGRRSGTGTGGGGSKKGVGKPGPPPAPKPVSIAAIKRRPMPIGNTDFISAKDYPAAAKQQNIQGQVKVRLIINDKGAVVKRTLIKRLGYGLDQLALKYAKRLRFKPAIDTNDKAVAAQIVWTFTFTLPK